MRTDLERRRARRRITQIQSWLQRGFVIQEIVFICHSICEQKFSVQMVCIKLCDSARIDRQGGWSLAAIPVFAASGRSGQFARSPIAKVILGKALGYANRLVTKIVAATCSRFANESKRRQRNEATSENRFADCCFGKRGNQVHTSRSVGKCTFGKPPLTCHSTARSLFRQSFGYEAKMFPIF